MFFESLQVRRLLAADVAVGFVRTSVPVEAVVGHRVRGGAVVVDLGNRGSEAVSASAWDRVNVQVLLRRVGETGDAGGDGEDGRVVGVVGVSGRGLGPGSQRRVAVNVKLPRDLVAGSYVFSARAVLPEGVVDEEGANNVVEAGGLVVSAARADLAISASTSLGGTVAAGTAGTVRFRITNLGNVTARTTGAVEVQAVIGSGAQTIAVSQRVRLTLGPGKSFSSRAVSFLAPGLAGIEYDPQLSVRFVSLSGTLVGDDPANNSAGVSSGGGVGGGGGLRVGQPLPSALGEFGLGSRLVFRFVRQVRTAGVEGVEEIGTFVDREFGREGTYSVRLVRVIGGGEGLGGIGPTGARSGVLTLRRVVAGGDGGGGGSVLLSARVTLGAALGRVKRLGGNTLVFPLEGGNAGEVELLVAGTVVRGRVERGGGDR